MSPLSTVLLTLAFLLASTAQEVEDNRVVTEAVLEPSGSGNGGEEGGIETTTMLLDNNEVLESLPVKIKAKIQRSFKALPNVADVLVNEISNTALKFRNSLIPPQEVNVSLYYETLCPDSVRFVLNQLQPTWEQLAGYMNIRFIPFGKSESRVSRRRELSFYCQHGPKECLGNKMQSCALSLLPTQESQVQFVSCVMGKSDPSSAGTECSRVVGLEFIKLRECYYSSLSDELQLAAERETNSIRNPLRFVPTIVYNGVFSQTKQDQSLHNFKRIVCSHIPQPPEACLA